MTTKRGNTFLLICAFVVGVGCSQPSSGYNIQRIDNALLVFLAMEDTSKIVEAKIDNHNLNIKIENDGEIVETVIKLKKNFFFSLVEADETIKVHGVNRINRYGVVHLSVNPPIPNRTTMSFSLTGIKVKGKAKEQGSHANTGAFRIGNRLIAYSLLPDMQTSSWGVSNFGVSIKYETKTPIQNMGKDTDGRLLKLDIDDMDVPVSNLKFPLNQLRPDETVEVKNQTKIGEDLYIVDLSIIPMTEDQTPVSEKKRPFDNSTIIDR